MGISAIFAGMNCKTIIRMLGGKPYTHLFFDLDRTLWDFEANARVTLSDLYHEFELYSHFKSFDEFCKTFQTHNERLWAEYRHGRVAKETLRKLRFTLTLKSAKVKNDALASTLDMRYIADSPTKTTLIPNAIELMEYLKQRGYRMLIITNGFNEVQWIKIRACGLEQYFDQMLTSENVGHQKPDVRIFEKALAEAGCKPGKALMVGDDFEVDIAGARNAGIDQVFFNPNGLDRSFKPTYEIRDLMELKAVL
jgi:putative hydrolase of the HAD superfamily